MNRTLIALLVGAPVLLGIGLLVSSISPNQPGSPSTKVSFYQDSMHPWIKSDQPGKCTICSMDLTPIYEGQAGFGLSSNVVVLNTNSITVLQVQTSEVKNQPLRNTLRVAGTLTPNETRKTIVSAPVPCRIQTMAVEYVGAEVKQGQSLVGLFSPELVQKAGYFRNLAVDSRNAALPLNLSKGKSDAYSGEIVAPQSGVVVERNAYVGQYVAEGEKLLTIVDPSVLWFRFDVYDRQLSWLEVGQKIEVTVPAVAGKVFSTVIAFIESTLDETTRTVKVRADINNPPLNGKGNGQRLLRFGMYAEGRVRTETPEVLAVPRSAILFPGRAAYVYVDRENGAYERRRVKLGRQGDDSWEILGGLDEGDRVVTSGNVLIDAQAQFALGSQFEDDKDAGMTAMESTPPSDKDEHSGHAHQPSMDPDTTPTITGSPPGPQAGTIENPVALPPQDSMSQEQDSPGTNRPLSRAALSSARMAYKEEMWRNRLALIAAAHGQKSAETPPSMTDSQEDASLPAANETPSSNHLASAPADTAKEMGAGSSPAHHPMPETQQAPGVQRTNLSYNEMDQARRAVRDEMQLKRQIALAQGQGLNTNDLPFLTLTQRQIMAAWIADADGVSRALAADNLDQFGRYTTNLTQALPALRESLGKGHRWSKQVQSLLTACQWQPAKDLAEARRQFLPFSTAMVELAKLLRKSDPGFATLKIYHCPMAPEPGLWIQSKGPLANPFYGAKMLRCGEEVGP